MHSKHVLKGQILAPRIQNDGSIQFKPLLDHIDPDFKNLTYGEPWGRIDRLDVGDIAFFIESATKDEWKSWSYFVVAYFVVENVYKYRSQNWLPIPSKQDRLRIDQNAHKLRGDAAFSILLGSKIRSKLMLEAPFRMSECQSPTEQVRVALRLGSEKHLVGYWWKKWFDSAPTEGLLELIVGSPEQVLE